jgi:hypothetical protein
MGVSFYVCTKCECTYPDCSSRCAHCESCESGFCSDECAGIQDDNTPGDTRRYELVSCVDCRGENPSDANLLRFAMNKLDVDRPALEADYLANGGKHHG